MAREIDPSRDLLDALRYERQQARIDRVRAAGACAVVLAIFMAALHFEYTGLVGWWLR